MSQYDERDLGKTHAGQNPLADFDALRARRIAEQEANEAYEPTVPVYEYESDYGRGYGYGYGYAAEPTRTTGGSTQPPRGKGRLRSTVVLLGVAVFVVGLGAGVYAATRPTGTAQPTAAAPPATTSASANTNANAGGSMSADPSASAGSGMGSTGDASPQPSQPAKTARGTLTELAVLDVADGWFTATTAKGAFVTVHINSQTQFGTQAQPFSQSDLAPGAVVWARVRRSSNGALVATVITGANTGFQGAQTSPADGSAN